MDWKSRFKNPVFWINNGLAIVVPIMAYYNLQKEDFTTWISIYDVIKNSIKNPYVVLMVIVSLWNNITNPTVCIGKIREDENV